MPGSFQRLENTKKSPPLEALEGTRPCQHLDFRFLDSRAARDYISVVLSHPICSTLLQQPSETNTHSSGTKHVSDKAFGDAVHPIKSSAEAPGL